MKYLVEGQRSYDYEGYDHWHICYFDDKEEAEKFAAECLRTSLEYLNMTSGVNIYDIRNQHIVKPAKAQMVDLSFTGYAGDHLAYNVVELLTYDEMKELRHEKA